MSESDKEKREQYDSVTVGQLRKRQLDLLEKQISELAGIIRAGYFKRDQAECFLKKEIGETLTKLQNIDAMASTEVLFPQATSP